VKAVIGLDVGTQAVRAIAVGEDGTLLAQSSAPLDTSYPAPAQAEQDANQWWRAACSVLEAVTASPAIRGHRIVALGYACTSCTVVALDQAGEPIRPALLWMDERATREARQVTETASPVLRYSGGIVSPQWMLPKLKWIMTHEPDVYARAYRIVEQTDYFTYHLTGRWTLGYGNLVAKWNYANPCGGWPEGFLEQAGVAPAISKWPSEILPLGTPIGAIRSEVADAVGLPRGTLVTQGGVDSHIAMMGSSVIRPGELAVVMGSSTIVIGQADWPVFADNWGPYPDAVVPGAYTLGGGQSTTGAVIRWLVRSIGGAGAVDAATQLERLEAEARAIEPGSEGLVALDYFGGARTPRKDPDARGVIVGLTLRHELPHLLRAFYEAIAYGARHIVGNLVEHGYQVNRVAASGGGSRSELAVQILADVLRQPIALTEEPESTALGAAIVAGVGAGLFESYETAIAALVHVRRTVEPQDANREVYDFYFDQYLKAYASLEQLMHDVARFRERRASPAAVPEPG
jgi:FGGY-family pentulose kinase